MTETFKIITWDYKVGKRYYSFNYKIYRGRKLLDEGRYDSTHSRSPQTMRKYLNTGYASELIIRMML